MAEPFLGEVRMMSFNFPPRGWAFCNGQLISIIQNQALFSLLGTAYGGDGSRTFGLPNLQGRIPIHFGSGSFGQVILGQTGGEIGHTLLLNEVPAHNHPMFAAAVSADTGGKGLKPGPTLALAEAFATEGSQPTQPVSIYATGGGANETFSGSAIVSSGSGQSHSNLQPYLAITFCIALQGIFPSRN